MIKISLKGLLLSVFILMLLSVIAFAADPGSPIPTGATNDQQPASVLVYNFFSSDATGEGQDTKITITNINTSQSVAAHFFFISGADCSAADFFICLTPNHTASVLASDLDPGVTGYLIAVATDRVTELPIGFNFLIGDAHVKLNSGHEAKLDAEGIQALFQGTLDTGGSFFATIDFDGVEYSKVASVLALDHIPSRKDGNRTMLVVNSLSGNLVTNLTSLGTVLALIYDDAEAPIFFSTSATCQLNRILSDYFPITTPSFTTFIPSGRSGWLRLSSTPDRGISGAVINFNRRSARERNAFNGGSNLHHLTNTAGTSSLTIPVFPPTC